MYIYELLPLLFMISKTARHRLYNINHISQQRRYMSSRITKGEFQSNPNVNFSRDLHISGRICITE
jgi:hypothetical protein